MPRVPTALARPAAAAAALFGAAALACAGAPAAGAAPDGPARVERAVAEGAQVRLEGGESVDTTLYSLRIDDSASVAAYGAALGGRVDHSAAYVESGFDALEAPEDAAGPVAWVVAHSYPSVALEDLDAPGAGGLNESQAIAATQAAVWHFTDGAELAGPGGSGGNDPRVERFYRHLVSEAEQAPAAPAAPTLSLAPGRISGADPAAPLGPLRVSTTGTGPVRVAVNGAPGARLADAEGETVAEVSDGEEFYLHVPADPGAGVATVHARAGSAALAPGRAFSGRDGVATLPVVAAEEALTGASAEVKADWSTPGDGDAPGPGAPPMPEASSHAPVRERPEPTASPAPSASPSPAAPGSGAADAEASDGLALTGTWLGGLLAIGGGLVAAGVAAFAAARLLKRR